MRFTRSEGATCPFFPRAQAEIIVGTAITAVPIVDVSLIKFRLLRLVILFGFRKYERSVLAKGKYVEKERLLATGNW